MSFDLPSTSVYLPPYPILLQRLNENTWTASRLILGTPRAKTLIHEIARCFSNHIASRALINPKVPPLVVSVGEGFAPIGFPLVEAECLAILGNLVQSSHQVLKVKASRVMRRE